jgi:hypothetical protein
MDLLVAGGAKGELPRLLLSSQELAATVPYAHRMGRRGRMMRFDESKNKKLKIVRLMRSDLTTAEAIGHAIVSCHSHVTNLYASLGGHRLGDLPGVVIRGIRSRRSRSRCRSA